MGEQVRSDGAIHLYSLRTSGAKRIPLAPPGTRLRFLGPQDGWLYARDIATDSAHSFRARLTPDCGCLAVEMGGRLVHTSWVTGSSAWARELRMYVRPPAGHLYVFESFTRPEARGMGIWTFTLRALAAHAAKAGGGEIWVGVERGATPATTAVEHAGFSRAATVPWQRRWGAIKVGSVQGREDAAALLVRRP